MSLRFTLHDSSKKKSDLVVKPVWFGSSPSCEKELPRRSRVFTWIGTLRHNFSNLDTFPAPLQTVIQKNKTTILCSICTLIFVLGKGSDPQIRAFPDLLIEASPKEKSGKRSFMLVHLLGLLARCKINGFQVVHAVQAKPSLACVKVLRLELRYEELQLEAANLELGAQQLAAHKAAVVVTCSH